MRALPTRPRVGIVGATGAVGAELLAVLAEREFPLAELKLFASARSAGRQLEFRGEALEVEAFDPDAFADLDLALFSAGGGMAREQVPAVVEHGAIAIDNSSAFRQDPAVPLVVPEVNAQACAGHNGILANPNCSTILMVLALAPLQRAVGIRRVVVATYQAASGAGQRAVDELWSTSAQALRGEAVTPEVMAHQLAFNVFPHVDVFEADGYTREESKMLHETRKILDRPDLPVEATCVRVPVARSHSEAVTVQLEGPLTPDAARKLFADAPGLEVLDDPESAAFPQPLHVANRDPVVVGRIRESRVFDPGLSLWLAGDQLRKGAALNAVQIAECLLPT